MIRRALDSDALRPIAWLALSLAMWFALTTAGTALIAAQVRL